MALLHGVQVRCAAGLTYFSQKMYGRALAAAMRWRYVTLAVCLVALAVALAYPMSGKMGFNLMPSIASDSVGVTAAVPPGTPEEELEAVRTRLTEAAQRVIDESGGEGLSEGLFSTASETEARVTAYLTSADDRPITAAEFVSRWRDAVGTIDGLAWMRFDSDRGGPGGGPSLTVGLSHPDVDTLRRASEVLAERVSALEHVDDVDDGFSQGKPQWNIRVNEAGSALGLNPAMIGNQLRAGMFGTEAFRLLRGGNEVTVRVQLPEAARSSRTDVSSFMLRTPEGHYVPLEEVATIERGEALTWISRRDGRRMGQVTASVTPPAQTNRVLATVRNEILPQMKRDFPQLAHSFEGQQETMRNAIDSFYTNVTLALLGIYALLALPFRSYVQPLIVMAAIPFGAVGAILGHLVMGYGLSLISVMGIIALGGVVVNGSLVMIDYANRRMGEGASVWAAAHAAGVRRFRPIFLTTVTTFGGLAPMIFETSVQAQFMIPMAVSLGFGILFSSAILLFFVPCLYVVMDDVRGLLGMGARERPSREALGRA
ncbi:MAG: efflux RND transporter permease subunit [Halofilum sp. (in: g-proteobacteria)]